MTGIKLPEPTPDQIEYLERIRAAGEDYDGSYVVGGPRKPSVRIEQMNPGDPRRRKCFFPCPRTPGKECFVLVSGTKSAV